MFQSVCKWSHIGLPIYGKISFLGLKLKGLVGKYESIMIMITVCELLIQMFRDRGRREFFKTYTG